MKSETFLLLPIFATVTNLFLALLCPPTGAQGQELHSRDDTADGARLDQVPLDHDIHWHSEDTFVRKNKDLPAVSSHDNMDEKDPMLKTMPGLDFEAYVRADIATFYGKEPGTVEEMTPTFSGQAGKFVNMSPEPLALFWKANDGSLSPISATIPAFASGGTATFPGHKFVFVKLGSEEPLATCSVVRNVSVYYYDPYSSQKDDSAFDPARCVSEPGSPSLDLAHESAESKQKYRAHKFNFAFAPLYKNFTGGSEWLSMYPRNKPRHPMWRADHFGQTHHIETRETQFHTDPGAAMTRKRKLSMGEMRRNHERDNMELAEFRHPGVLNLTLRAVSCAPRAFEIKNFLSDVEVDHILNHVKSLDMARSTTGEAGRGHVHTTRTSQNTWVPRHSDLLLNSIYRRAADALRMDESLFRTRNADEFPELPTRSSLNEDMQIVHYKVGQEYTAHHDFGYPRGNHPDSPSRSINLCMYLNDVEEGGETAFPRWRNAETGEAIKVKPEKGKAMIFYMVNPDGNLDDLTQHAAMPVISGEKYFLNLWIHDPIRM